MIRRGLKAVLRTFGRREPCGRLCRGGQFRTCKSHQAEFLEKYTRMVKRQRRNPENPLVFLDVAAGGEQLGRVVIELFKDIVPKVFSRLNCTNIFCPVVEGNVVQAWTAKLSVCKRKFSTMKLMLRGPADCREFSWSLHRRVWLGENHRYATPFQERSIPPHHSRLHVSGSGFSLCLRSCNVTVIFRFSLCAQVCTFLSKPLTKHRDHARIKVPI